MVDIDVYFLCPILTESLVMTGSLVLFCFQEYSQHYRQVNGLNSLSTFLSAVYSKHYKHSLTFIPTAIHTAEVVSYMQDNHQLPGKQSCRVVLCLDTSTLRIKPATLVLPSCLLRLRGSCTTAACRYLCVVLYLINVAWREGPMLTLTAQCCECGTLLLAFLS